MRNYEPNADRVVALYQQLEDDIITAMIRRMMRMGKVSDTTKYQAEIMQQAGLLYTDIVQIITARTDACSAAVKALFEDAGVETVSIENDIHETAEQLPVNIRQSSPMRRVLEAGYRKTQKTLRNLVGTTASTTQQAFYDACDRSYTQVSSGAFSYQEAIRTAVRSLADTGAYVTYPTGHRDRIDVAVRRCTLTGVGQTSAAVSKTYAEETGCHLMELTAHSGARPEHARWQGQLVTLTGEDAGETIDGLHVYTLHEIGYGSGEGFKGWNCRHDWHAYYKGISKPNYTLEQIKKLNEKNISYNGKKYTKYEISQVQRQGERNVRVLKRRTLASQAAVENAPDEETKAVLQADYAANAAKLKESEKQLKTFCSQTGQRRDTFREQVDGFGRSAAQKAVHAAKRQNQQTGTLSAEAAGHAVEITPLTSKDNGGTGKTYSPEKITTDYMSRFTPKYSDQTTLTSGNVHMSVKKVANSRYQMYADADADRKNKAVRLTEKTLSAIQPELPKDFQIPKVAVVDFQKYRLNPNAIAGYDKITDTMYMNSIYDSSEKILKYVNLIPGQFANNTEYAPILHELGHKFYEDCIKRLAISENIGYNESKKKIDRRIFDYIEKQGNPDYLLCFVSGYASDGELSGKFTEIIAECFSVRKKNAVADAILALLE